MSKKKDKEEKSETLHKSKKISDGKSSHKDKSKKSKEQKPSSKAKSDTKLLNVVDVNDGYTNSTTVLDNNSSAELNKKTKKSTKSKDKNKSDTKQSSNDKLIEKETSPPNKSDVLPSVIDDSDSSDVETEAVAKKVKVNIESDTEQDKELIKQVLQNDPYLIDQKEDIQKLHRHRWTNKQRTLTLCTRGITALHRHLLDDFRKIMPHSVSDVKWDKKLSFDNIPEAAELKNCSNILFFEIRKHTNVFMYLSKTLSGPTIKFQMLDVVSMLNTNFTGNCIRNSRPLLVFTQEFSQEPHLQLIKEMFIQVIGCPRNHPKSRPFHDHTLSFTVDEDQIHVRHYAIFNPKSRQSITEQELREIGPRLTLVPLRIFEGAFRGKTLWKANKPIDSNNISQASDNSSSTDSEDNDE